MIALLPLRGWVGDAMAMDMAAASMALPASAAESAADHAAASPVATEMDAANEAHADCLTHAPAQDGELAATSHCDACSACQLCHAFALTAAVLPLAPAQPSTGRLPGAAPFFVSAERAPDIKPPIS